MFTVTGFLIDLSVVLFVAAPVILLGVLAGAL